MKIFIKGLNSCTMRKQKLQQYRSFIVANGHEIVTNPHDSDKIFIWTCAFRGDVRDNSISEIKRYQKEFSTELIVGGCLPDIYPDLLKNNFNGHIITWKNDRECMINIFGNRCKFDDIIFAEDMLCDNIEKFKKENPDKPATFHDQFIKLLISEGCNYKCSYCSERLAFPPYHSFPEDKLVDICRNIVEKTGHLNVMLMSDSLGDYGYDTGSNLPKLVRKLRDIHPDLKIALNNLNPLDFVKFFDDMVKFLKDGLICHLNLPIQSASSHILKLMNRPYTREDMDKTFGLLNDMCFKEFDTHIIVGFPGETEDDFKETIDFILKHIPRYVLASSFMESPNMDTYKFSHKIDEQTKRFRLKNFENIIKSMNIICNIDDSDLSIDRCRRLNIILDK